MDKRVSKPPKRYIDEIKGTKKTISKKQKKQRQVKQPVQKAKEPEQANDEIINPKTIHDYDDNTNPYWVNHYYTPNDNINKEYEQLTTDYAERFNDFPFVFLNGIAQLEVKKEFQQPIKERVSFKKLKEGFYEIKSSKSDKTNISNTISFFRKNLPSFKQYKDNDDISWVALEDRKLLNEILKYSLEKKSAITTIKGKINAMCRIIRLAYKTKNLYKYQKYSHLVSSLGITQSNIDSKNVLTETEFKKFLPYEIILDYQNKLMNDFNAMTEKEKLSKRGYELNQKLLLLSLYTLIHPLRDEPKTLEFTFTKKQDNNDYIYFKEDGDVMLLLNKEKKRHIPEDRNITKEAPLLVEILKQSYKLYPRPYLFATLKDGKYKKKVVSTLSATLVKIFSKEYPYINVGSSSIRSSFYSYANTQIIKEGFPLSYETKEFIAEKMRTSVEQLDKSYLKIYKSVLPNQPQPIAIQQIQPEEQPLQNIEIPKSNTYYKKLERNKEYIKQNKDEVYKKQKEYRQSIPKETQTRNRILRLLNNDVDYRNHIKQKTIEKYDIKLGSNNKYF